MSTEYLPKDLQFVKCFTGRMSNITEKSGRPKTEIKVSCSCFIPLRNSVAIEASRALLLSGLDSYNLENLICSYGNPMQTVQR